ncbi:MAG: Gfo/Idh/MocA family oxidoreductase [Gemmatimonadaceae bacterium]|nr:Gfo/Idh/MocA family oxidoreductase [Gemmatimonadaceae bacterium]
MSEELSRRDFVARAAAIGAGVMIVPRHVLGGPGHVAPSDRLRIAIIGAGGMGQNNWMQLLDEQVVAWCDVDPGYVERQVTGKLRPRQDGTVNPAAVRLKESYDTARRYVDYRELLAQEKELDAVVIATPDHLHAAIAAAIAVAAMRARKHVYVQKPLCWSVAEARLLTTVWRETGVVAEMGNQGHSMEGTRRIREWIRAGVIGPVREVHVWTDRPQRYWAQALPWPTQDRSRPAPAAQDIAYHPAYHPFTWRGWVPFGVGAIGDMGAHLLDQPMFALDLEHPETISASATPWGGPADNPASYPNAMLVQFGFGKRGSQPPVSLSWYDGGLMPPRPPFLPRELTLPRGDGGGGVFVGERGILTYGTYGENPRIYPDALQRDADAVAKSVPRIELSHEANWVRACKRQGEPSAPFSYSAQLTELMLLGLVASRAGNGTLLAYDGPAMKVTNLAGANVHLARSYRAGWEL